MNPGSDLWLGRQTNARVLCSQFMHERYNQVCDQIFQYKDHRDPLVRRAVIELIPTLASYNHLEFTQHYLHKAMVYLLGQLKKDRDRTTSESSLAGLLFLDPTDGSSPAFHAIGHVAVHVKSAMAPYLDAILVSVKEGLQARGRKGAPSEDSIFQCISMLASSVGQALTKHMHELLDLMIAYGLSEPLHKALNDLGRYIPQLLPTIQGAAFQLVFHSSRLTRWFCRATAQSPLPATEWGAIQNTRRSRVAEVTSCIDPARSTGFPIRDCRYRHDRAVTRNSRHVQFQRLLIERVCARLCCQVSRGRSRRDSQSSRLDLLSDSRRGSHSVTDQQPLYQAGQRGVGKAIDAGDC